MSKPIDPVVIRVWREKDGDVFALFPVLSADNNGYHCTSYQHIGQHGAADYRLCIDRSRPATAEEAAPLLAELKAIGYNPPRLQASDPGHAGHPAGTRPQSRLVLRLALLPPGGPPSPGRPALPWQRRFARNPCDMH